MGLRNRKGGADAEATTKVDDNLNEEAKDLMGDHLEMMKEVVMRIREDEEFARNIYADCPRLQNLLDRNPDLRPIFEDPNLVRINFEQVYKDAGGVLPEDEKPKMKCLTWFVNSPIFKFLRFLLLIKKVIGCITGGGLGMITGCFVSIFCCGPDDIPTDLDPEGDDADGGNPENATNREALNSAADYMENPEVQAQMDQLMENPENLEEAIENDEELRALRDSNPLCAELMSDPETMKILTDPENLRALGETPDLIEADFADPNWTAPDLEMGDPDYDMDMDESVPEVNASAGDADVGGVEGEEVVGEEGEEVVGEEEEEEVPEELVPGEEVEAEPAAWEEAEIPEGDEAQQQAQQGGRAQQQQKQQQQAEGEEEGGVGATIGSTIRDIGVGALVGYLGADLFGGGDDIDGAAAAADSATIPEIDTIENVAAASETVTDAEYVTTLEEGMNEGEGAMAAHDDQRRAMATGAAVGAGVGLAAGAAADKSAAEKAAAEEEEQKKGGWFASMGSSVFTAARDQLAAKLLGDDLAEYLTEKLDAEKDKNADNDDKEDEESIGKDDEEDAEEQQQSKRALFRLSKD